MQEEQEERLQPVVVSIERIISFLHSGVTRKKGDNNYNPDLSSVQEIYGLTTEETNDLFRDVRLKNLKVRVPKVSRITILEDTFAGPDTVVESVLEIQVITETSAEDLTEEYPTQQILDTTLVAEIPVGPGNHAVVVETETF